MSGQTDISTLLDDSGLDEATVTVMKDTNKSLGPAIEAGLGNVKAEDIMTSEVIVVTQLLDDSTSIGSVPGNAEAVCSGSNLVRSSIIESKEAATAVMSCRFLNPVGGNAHGVLYPYSPLEQTPTLSTDNYHPAGMTPLYDQTAVTLTGVAAKIAEYEQGGIHVTKAITVIVTDGADERSLQYTAASIRTMVQGLLRTEIHAIFGMGIQDGHTDFRRVFQEMGLPEQAILTPGNSPSEIRRAFEMVSQSAVGLIGGNQGYSEVSLGAFGQN
jgi:hypothetical protein